MRGWRLFGAALVGLSSVAVGACTEGLRGAPMEMPRATGKPVARAMVGEPEGLIVLWNGRTNHGDMSWKTWIAGSQEELEAVWSAAAPGDAPRVDFAKYIVLAAAGTSDVCRQPKIVGIEAEYSGRLILHYEHEDELQLETCIHIATRIARIVAVPRRILPATVVFLDGYAFAVPEVPFH